MFARVARAGPLLVRGALPLNSVIADVLKKQGTGAVLAMRASMATNAGSGASTAVVPWVACGFVTNSTMLLAGDILDAKIRHLSFIANNALCFYGDWTAMGCAGFANILAGAGGIVVVGMIGGSGAFSAGLPIRLLSFAVGATLGLAPVFWPDEWRLWEAGSAAKRVNTFSDDARKLGINAEELSAGLLKHLSSSDESFTDMDLASFVKLIGQASPQYASKATGLWKVVNSNGQEKIDFQQMFVVLMSGRSTYNMVKWTEKEYGCKSGMIDADHRKLFGLINQVTSALQTADVEAVGKAIKGLREYTVYHFDREAAMLRKNPAYPQAEMDKHMAAHAAFVAKVSEFEGQFAKQNVGSMCKLATGDLMSFVLDWLVNHIQRTDMKLHTFFPNGIPQSL